MKGVEHGTVRGTFRTGTHGPGCAGLPRLTRLLSQGQCLPCASRPLRQRFDPNRQRVAHHAPMTRSPSRGVYGSSR